MSKGKMVVYGGRGSLGAACVRHFKTAKWWVASVDLKPNLEADYNITVPEDASWVEQERHVMTMLNTTLIDEKLKAVICVAGGWVSGNISKDLCKQADLMWRQSVWSSLIAASIASKHLSTGGILALTGANMALDKPTPRAIGYGMAKAAVHQLTKSLGAKDSGMPENSLVVAVLPVLLETPMNRKWMRTADFRSCTPLPFVTNLLDKWIKGDQRPPTGSLVSIITKENVTKVVVPKPEPEDLSVHGVMKVKE